MAIDRFAPYPRNGSASAPGSAPPGTPSTRHPPSTSHTPTHARVTPGSTPAALALFNQNPDVSLADEQARIEQARMEIEPPLDDDDHSDLGRGDGHSNADLEHSDADEDHAFSDSAQRATQQRASNALIRTFNTAASHAGLNQENRAIGLKFCDLGQREGQGFVAYLVNRLELHQSTHAKLDLILARLSALEAERAAETTALPHIKELRQWLKDNATMVIARGDLPAYTATEDSTGDTILHSLPNVLWTRLFASPKVFRDRMMGANYGTVPSTNPGDPVRKAVADKSKAARTFLQSVVLTNIQVPGAQTQAPDLPVPDLNSVTYTLKKPIGAAGGVQLTRDDILGRTEDEEFARNAFLRLSLVDWAYNRERYPNKSQWAVIDARLEELSHHTPRYQYGYALLCLEDEKDRFDGIRTFTDVQAYMAEKGLTWDLPDAGRMTHVIAAITERFGEFPAPGEARYKQL